MINNYFASHKNTGGYGMQIILASGSERRHELLKRLTDDFEIIVSNFDEEAVAFEGNCSEYVKTLSIGKALNVGSKFNNEVLVIGCDTIVALDGKVLGKPADKEDAFNMLKTLSGKSHHVYSGIAIYNCLSKKIITDFVKTEVKFSVLSEADILKYIDTGECLDKAGGYGIQGYGGVFVEEIHGCYYNVVGLPLNKLKSMLREMGVNL